MIDWTELTLLLYILARMSGFVLFNPIFGRFNVPPIYRAGFSMVLAVSAMSSVVTQQSVTMPVSFLDLSIRILLELAVGFFLGMVMEFFFYIPSLVSEMVDMQMGMSMNKIYDPGSAVNMSVTGILINIMMFLLFFAANGHHTLLRIVLTSGEIVPYGTASFGQEAAQAMLKIFIECTLLAVKLALPIVGAELAGQVGMGVLMKVIPQINVFVINIELKIMIGLGLLIALASTFSEYLLKAEMQMLKDLEMILRLAGG